LLENAATNLLVRSAEFDNASWSKSGLITAGMANVATAPDGTLTADVLTEDTSTGNHRASQVPTLAANTTSTFSIYAKRLSGSRNLSIQMVGSGGSDSFIIYFNLGSGVVGSTSTTGTGSIAASAMVPAGNGWFRCSVTGIHSTTVALGVGYVSMASATTVGSDSFTGDGASGILVWGAQLEASSFASTYIGTAGATVTRAIEVPEEAAITRAIQGRSAFSGVFRLRAPQVASGILFEISDGTVNNRITASLSSGAIATEVVTGGVSQGVTTTANTVAANTAFGMAFRVAANNVAVCLNGGTVATDTTVTLPTGFTRSALAIRLPGGATTDMRADERLIYPFALSDTALQAQAAAYA
jgi:hypothetical protein